EDERAREALPRLLGAHARRHRVAPEQDARGVAADVARDDEEDEQQDPARPLGRVEHEHDEACEERQVRRRKGARDAVAQRSRAAPVDDAPDDEPADREHEGHELGLGTRVERGHEDPDRTDDERDERVWQVAERYGLRAILQGRAHRDDDEREERLLAQVQRRDDEAEQAEADDGRDREVATGARAGDRGGLGGGGLGHQTSSSSLSLPASRASTVSTCRFVSASSSFSARLTSSSPASPSLTSFSSVSFAWRRTERIEMRSSSGFCFASLT